MVGEGENSCQYLCEDLGEELRCAAGPEQDLLTIESDYPDVIELLQRIDEKNGTASRQIRDILMRSDPQGPLRRSFEGECQSVRFRACFIFLGLAGLQMLGCVGFAERLRQYTYPPDFHYISTEQLRSTMWQLAYHSRELNRLMTPPSSAESHRVQILDHLESMEQVIIELNRTAWPTNHPLIDKNRSNFLRDIKMAEQAIRREPPNF